MKVTPQAIQELFDELEASKQARRLAWEVLQRLRAILVECGRVRIATPEKKMFRDRRHSSRKGDHQMHRRSSGGSEGGKIHSYLQSLQQQ
jgi:hypothetical protein